MTTINFPSSPTNGQVFTDGDHTWVFSSVGAGGPGAWQLEAQTVTGPTGPTGPTGTAGPVAERNMLVNGNLKIWQRNTSTSTNLAYSADRWFINTNGTATATFSRIDTSAQSVGSQYGARCARSAGTDIWGIITCQEGGLNLVGKSVTLSGYLRKGASYTGNVNVTFGTRATKFGTVYDSANITVNNASLSTSTWYRFSTTMTVTTSTSTNNADIIEIELLSSSQLGGTNVHFEVAALQMEIGTSATEFEQEDQSLTLMRCKRYYQQSTIFVPSSTPTYTFVFPVTMRIAPVVAGGGSGFSSTTTATESRFSQTSNAAQTLTFDADF